MKRCSVLFQRPSWRSALKVSRPQTPNWKRNTDSWVLDHSNMKLVAVFVFLAYCLAVGVDSASVSLSTNSMTLNGNAHIQFYGPREEIWNGLSDGKILNDSYTFFHPFCSRRNCWSLYISILWYITKYPPKAAHSRLPGSNSVIELNHERLNFLPDVVSYSGHFYVWIYRLASSKYRSIDWLCFSLKVTDIPSSIVVTPLPCVRLTLLAPTQSTGCYVEHPTVTGIPAPVLWLLGPNGLPVLTTWGLLSTAWAKWTDNQSTVVIQLPLSTIRTVPVTISDVARLLATTVACIRKYLKHSALLLLG